MGNFKEYLEYDGVGLARLVERKEVQPLELVEAAIARIEQHNPRLNAVVDRWYDDARAAAGGDLPPGPFRGVPYLLKDLLIHVEGQRITSASRYHENFVSRHDSEMTARLRRAGLILLGRTNCPELGILGFTAPELHGPCRNPWNPEHTPGGSSGGAGASVAAGMVPMAAAGDGGGSIRIPASACGLFGLKPTRGRTPLGPDLGESWNGYVVQHAITRSVRDSAALLDATAGPELGDPYWAPPLERPLSEELSRAPGRLKIAYCTGSLFGKAQHPDCVAAVEDAVALCKELGHELVEARPEVNAEALVQAYFVVVCASVAATIADMGVGQETPPQSNMFEPTTWMLNLIGQRLSAARLNSCLLTAHRAGRRVARFHQEYDLFLISSLAYPPKRVGEQDVKGMDLVAMNTLNTLPIKQLLFMVLDKLGSEALEATPNTQLFNQTGQPAMSVPLLWSDEGLPIGVQFAARFGDEATLLRLASQLEQARPWDNRRPPL